MGKKLTTPEFIIRSNQIHNDKYEYPSPYVSGKMKIKIVCPLHGEFYQRGDTHLVGKGCPKCGDSGSGRRYDLETFITLAKKVHGDAYDYSKVVYKIGDLKVEIVCPSHGSFWQTAKRHLAGGGCSICYFDTNKGRDSCRWRGHGELSRDHWSSIVREAKKRNIEVSITIEYAWELFFSQNRKCALTGCPLRMHIPGVGNYSYKTGRKRASWTASLDRIDSSKGYVEGNVQWVHVDINLMKLHHSTQRFYELCYAVVNYRQQLQTMSAGK